MSDNITNLQDRVKPAYIIDNKTGKTYELDFSRESVKFAETRGFKPDELTEFPVTRIPELFFYAFRKNYKNMTRTQTNDLLERMGGLTTNLLERLMQLYNQAALTHLIVDPEEEIKNAEVTVEL